MMIDRSTAIDDDYQAAVVDTMDDDDHHHEGAPSQQPYLFTMIPLDILSNIILGQYCSGKTISTFTIVLEGCCYRNSSNNRHRYHNRKRPTSHRNNTRKGNEQNRTDLRSATHDGSSHNNILLDYQMMYMIVRNTFQTRYHQLTHLLHLQIEQQEATREDHDDDDDDDDDDTDDEEQEEIEVFDDMEYIHHLVLSELNDDKIRNDDDNDETNTNTNHNIQYHYETNRHDHIMTIQNRMKHISHYCAMIDYFELHGRNHPTNETTTTPHGTITGNVNSEYIVWIGPIQTSHGMITNGILTCSDLCKWTSTSLLYWYHDYEVYEYTLTTPYRTPTNIAPKTFYGTLRTYDLGSTLSSHDDPFDHDHTSSLMLSTIQHDNMIIHSIYNTLNDEYDPLGRYSLVPRHLGFDHNPSISFTKKTTRSSSISPVPQLNCYWDQRNDDHHSWEEGIDELCDNIIRILRRLSSLLLVRQNMENNINNNNNIMTTSSTHEDNDDQNDGNRSNHIQNHTSKRSKNVHNHNNNNILSYLYFPSAN